MDSKAIRRPAITMIATPCSNNAVASWLGPAMRVNLAEVGVGAGPVAAATSEQSLIDCLLRGRR